MKTSSNDEKILWKMYIWSGVKALSRLSGEDGVVILRTEKENEYCFPVYQKGSIMDVTALTDTLRKADDIRVSYLTMSKKSACTCRLIFCRYYRFRRFLQPSVMSRSRWCSCEYQTGCIHCRFQNTNRCDFS